MQKFSHNESQTIFNSKYLKVKIIFNSKVNTYLTSFKIIPINNISYKFQVKIILTHQVLISSRNQRDSSFSLGSLVFIIPRLGSGAVSGQGMALFYWTVRGFIEFLLKFLHIGFPTVLDYPLGEETTMLIIIRMLRTAAASQGFPSYLLPQLHRPNHIIQDNVPISRSAD